MDYSFDRFFPLDEHWQEDSCRGLSFNILVDLAMTIPEFSELPIKAVRNFASRMKPVDFKPGQTLFKAGQKAQSIYFVVQGAIWSFDARTSGSTLVLELKAKEFYDLLKTNPKIHEHFEKARERFEEIRVLDQEAKKSSWMN